MPLIDEFIPDSALIDHFVDQVLRPQLLRFSRSGRRYQGTGPYHLCVQLSTLARDESGPTAIACAHPVSFRKRGDICTPPGLAQVRFRQGFQSYRKLYSCQTMYTGLPICSSTGWSGFHIKGEFDVRTVPPTLKTDSIAILYGCHTWSGWL